MSIEVTVQIREGRKHKDEVEIALREFKRLVKKSGVLQELRKREHYVAPSEKRRIKRKESHKQRKRDERKAMYQKKSSDF